MSVSLLDLFLDLHEGETVTVSMERTQHGGDHIRMDVRREVPGGNVGISALKNVIDLHTYATPDAVVADLLKHALLTERAKVLDLRDEAGS